MRVAARVTLAVVVLLGGLAVLPRFGSGRAFAGIAGQPVPTPLLSDILGEPSPKESEEPGGGGGGGGGEDPGGEDPLGGGEEDPKGGGGGGDRGDREGEGADGGSGPGAGRRASVIPPSGTPTIPGSFNTEGLMTISAHLRSLGWSAEDVIERVFPPFILAGEATWVDTWGAPRYGPGPIVRTHEGQDVFCDYGDPVLAPEAGVLSMSDGGLGGITSRVHLGDGSYWYLTHLSDWNTEEFANGDRVEEGDVIGFCGNSGNALTTPPHVHFGWYLPSGVAKNPMRRLVGWLEEAEARAANLIASVQGARLRKLPQLTVARRFGDAFAPDRSALTGAAGESLWASGRSPATGAFALAEAALQAALAQQSFAADFVEVPVSGEGAGTEGLLDPESTLAQLLEGRFELNEVDEAAD
ncbi:MAG: M23 family metallopeptidase [Gaiellales bacterium]